MSKEDKKVPVDNQEDVILKKIRYYQGTIDDYETFWKKKTAEGEKEECPETKAIKKKNDDLNKAFEIIPVEDETKENQPSKLTPEEQNDLTGEKDALANVEKDGEDNGKKKVKKVEKHKEKHEEKHEEEEEVKVKDEEKEEKGDDDDEKKKKKKEDED